MNLAEHIRIVLTEYGRRGVPFDDAWVYAMRSLPKGKNDIERDQLVEWKIALRWAKPHFQANFTQTVLVPDRMNGHEHPVGQIVTYT
jgi:hypothetical protein